VVENKFKKALKKSGILESSPTFVIEGNYYTVIKVTDEETIKTFLKEAEKSKIKVKASRYDPNMEIWVLKAYNLN